MWDFVWRVLLLLLLLLLGDSAESDVCRCHRDYGFGDIIDDVTQRHDISITCSTAVAVTGKGSTLFVPVLLLSLSSSVWYTYGRSEQSIQTVRVADFCAWVLITFRNYRGN